MLGEITLVKVPGVLEFLVFTVVHRIIDVTPQGLDRIWVHDTRMVFDLRKAPSQCLYEFYLSQLNGQLAGRWLYSVREILDSGSCLAAVSGVYRREQSRVRIKIPVEINSRTPSELEAKSSENKKGGLVILFFCPDTIAPSFFFFFFFFFLWSHVMGQHLHIECDLSHRLSV